MPSFPITSAKQKNLEEKMRHYSLLESDFVEKFIRGGGKGGQKRNKTSTCVQLLHKPTGIEVRCDRTRQQSLNRYYARQLLVAKIAQIVDDEISQEEQRIQKIRRQKRRRSKRAKEKVLRLKKIQSDKKRSRGRVGLEEA